MANKKEKEIAIVPSEIGATDLASVMKSEAEKRGLITQYISQHMKSGTDYGTIKFGTKESKPSLFKPGSEKFLSLFKLTARFEKDTDTWEMAGSENGVFAYKCQLVASNGNVVGEGRGVAKLTEKVGWTLNNCVKIAEKRAQIDAVLRTGALSDFFTQDLEDMQQNYDKSPVRGNSVPTVTYDNPEDINDIVPSKPKSTIVRNDQKKKIFDLINSITVVPLEKKEEFEEWVLNETGLALKQENYPLIIERLKALQ